MRRNKTVNALFISVVCLVAGMTSCQTSRHVIEESSLSATEHRKAIVAVFGDVRKISQNGRELFSHYHDKKFNFIDDPTKVSIRYFTKTSVLGVRRPFEVLVEVRRERKDPETMQFVDQGLDDGLSQKRLNELRTVLNQSRENSQEFDVENPF